MSQSLASGPSWRPLAFAGTVVVLLLAGTVALWAHYGTTVFFEMIRTGLATCFG
jgi:hypothetical protein